MIEFERTKELASKRKMSLKEVNDKAHLGTNTIYNWKTKKPGSDALSEVAHVLNTTLDYLKGKTDNPAIPDNTSDSSITWSDLGMPYGGSIPDDLKGYYKVMAEQYVKEHPDLFKGDE